MNDEMDHKLYVLAELNYAESHLEIDSEEIYPLNWYNSSNYKLKTEIIAEALEKNILIEETDLFKEACISNMFE